MATVTAPSGFRDLLPEAYRRRAELVLRIRQVYESFGFQGMETPAMENLAVFLGKGGGENEKLMFQVLKRGADLTRSLERSGAKELADMALRFDLTVPLARYFASHRAELPAIFKRYQIGPVWRAERAQYGRFREFTQCDIDVLGSASPMVEAEVITASAAVFADLGFDNLIFRLNSRPLLDLLVRSFGVSTSHTGAAFVAIDKLDKLSPDEVRAELVEKGISEEAAQGLLTFHAQAQTESGRARLDEVKKRVGVAGEALVAQLRSVLEITPPFAVGTLQFDPFLARGMDYYTGPVFEVVTEGVPFSLAGGGRFDQLIERLGGPSVPACGLSIGFERVYTIMEERNMLGGAVRAADALVAVLSPDDCAYALKLGSQLRALRVPQVSSPGAPASETHSRAVAIDVYPGSAKLVAQYQLAEQKGIPFVIVGDRSDQVETVTLRTIATRSDQRIPKAEIGSVLLQHIASLK